MRGRGGRVPVGDRFDVFAGHRLAVLVAKEVLEQNADRVRKRIDALEARSGQRVEAVNHDLTASGVGRNPALKGVL